MPCPITLTGISKGCKNNTGGIKRITISATPGVIIGNDIILQDSVVFEAPKQTGMFTVTKNGEENNDSLGYTTSLTYLTNKLDSDKRNVMMELMKASYLYLLVEDNNGTLHYLPEISASVVAETGTALQDANKYTVTFTSDNTTPPLTGVTSIGDTYELTQFIGVLTDSPNSAIGYLPIESKLILVTSSGKVFTNEGTPGSLFFDSVQGEKFNLYSSKDTTQLMLDGVQLPGELVTTFSGQTLTVTGSSLVSLSAPNVTDEVSATNNVLQNFTPFNAFNIMLSGNELTQDSIGDQIIYLFNTKPNSYGVADFGYGTSASMSQVTQYLVDKGFFPQGTMLDEWLSNNLPGWNIILNN